MINVIVSLTGDEIGGLLLSDEMELMYALKALAEDATDRTIERIVDAAVDNANPADIASFLRRLAGALDAAIGA